jgi:hypothetical protein
MPTSYEVMKHKWKREVAKMRDLISDTIRLSKDKAFHQAHCIGKKVRISKLSSAKILSDRKAIETRVKTARVAQIRRDLQTATESSRAKLMLKRISSANQIRTESRMRISSNNFNIA